MSNAVDFAAVMTTLLLTSVLEQCGWPPIYIGSDKGGGAVIVILYFFNLITNHIEKFLASVDDCDGTAEGIAYSIVHTMRRLKLTPGDAVSSVPERILCGQQTDSGGGGNIEALATELHDNYEELCAEMYLVGNCFEHNTSNSFAYPFNKAFGEGSIEKRNPIQLAHSCYDLLTRLGADVFTAFWESTVDSLDLSNDESVNLKSAKQIPAAIMTRWSYVSKAIQHVLTNWDVWLKLSEDIPKGTTTVEAVNKIASGLYANMHIPLNRVYLEFLLPFLLKVHDPMMQWCESSDPKVGKVGFRARQAAFAYYEYMDALEKLRRDYSDPQSQDFAAFRLLQEALSQPEKDIVDKSVAAFFKLARNKADEHFVRWISTNLIWLAVFDEASHGQLVARLLLGIDQTAPNGPDELVEDQTAPNGSDEVVEDQTMPDELVTFEQFLSMRFNKSLCVDLELVINGEKAALEAIAAGADMWDEVIHDSDSVLGKFRKIYFTHFSAFPTTNQDVERGVKKKNSIAETGRRSKKSSSYAIAGNLSLGLQPTVPDKNPTPDNTEDEDSGEDDGIMDTSKKKKRSPVGTHAAMETFTKAEAQWALVEKLMKSNAYKEASVSLKADVTDKEKDLQIERVARKLNKFEVGRESDKGLNAIQRKQDFDHTPLALGEIVWGDLRKAHHLEDVFKELQYRISTSRIEEIKIDKVAVKDKDAMQAGIQILYEGKKWMELKVILQKLERKVKTFKQYHPGEDLFKDIVL
jgi:hypothetical protein